MFLLREMVQLLHHLNVFLEQFLPPLYSLGVETPELHRLLSIILPNSPTTYRQ